MKKSTLPIMILIVLIVTGCSKESADDRRYLVDKEFYFTITFGGSTLTSYGFEDAVTKTKGGPSLLAVRNQWWIFDSKHATLQNINGVPAHMKGEVEVLAEFHDALISDFTGSYRNLSTGKLKDLKTGKVYVIDYQDVEFYVDGYNQRDGNGNYFAEGSFKCNLKEPNSNLLIPAVGRFRTHSGK